MPGPLQVLVVGPKHSGPDSRGGMATVVALMREHHDPRVRIRTVATYVDTGRARRWAVGVAGVASAVSVVLLRRCDVVHVHLAHRGSVVRKAVVLAAARRAGVASVVHAHSYDFAGWFDGLGLRGQRLVRRALRADAYFVLGDALVDEYASRLDVPVEQVRVLHNPVVAPEPAPVGTRGTVPQAVFLGRHGRRKGSYDLVAAVAALALIDSAPLRVIAAGDGEEEQVRAAAREAGVDSVLVVRGWVSPPERDALLAASDVFVLPSHDEGLPMALLEAMGAGLAPIVTAVGAIGEVVTDEVDALVIAPHDVDALAAALARLAGDRALRERLAGAARQRAAAMEVGPWFEAMFIAWTAVADGRARR